MDRFIVGSGRCGSTLLSRMLGCHPGVLDISEFFNGLDMQRRFARVPISGGEYAAMVGAEQPMVNAVLRRGYPVSEVVYPFDASASRYRRGDAVPWLLITLLPRLSATPDALYDSLLEAVRGFPEQTAAAHARSLFAWLGAELGGRDLWIERSGSSIHYFPALQACFPEARFLHLHREGVEVALSMREHHAYRLPISMLYDAPLGDGMRVSDGGAIDIAGEPLADDPISRILESRPPPELFGRYWADQIAAGVPALADLPEDRLQTLSFEALVRDPRPQLEAIADFFSLPASDADWIADAGDLVRGVPPTRLGALPEAEAAALVEACRGSQALLES